MAAPLTFLTDMSHLRDTWVGDLPKGCALCQLGGKMVLFISGMCTRRCFYCPISEERWLHDVVYANERRICAGDPDEAALTAIGDEVVACGALGTGITGGDPMDYPERVLAAIRSLKTRFGAKHHIHMYTSGRFDPSYLPRLAEAGLDEIRFHPPSTKWTRLGGTQVDRMIRAALRTGMDVGAEVPAIPGWERQTKALIRYLERVGVAFLNLNELEISETNFDRLDQRGKSTVKNEDSCGAKGGEEMAVRLVDAYQGPLTLHYCSASFKDGVQLRQRLIRRAERTARSYEEQTPDGTVVKGIIEVGSADVAVLEQARRNIVRRYRLPADLTGIEPARRRVELRAIDLERIASRVPYPCFIIEEQASATRLEVERNPLASGRPQKLAPKTRSPAAKA